MRKLHPLLQAALDVGNLYPLSRAALDGLFQVERTVKEALDRGGDKVPLLVRSRCHSLLADARRLTVKIVRKGNLPPSELEKNDKIREEIWLLFSKLLRCYWELLSVHVSEYLRYDELEEPRDFDNFEFFLKRILAILEIPKPTSLLKKKWKTLMKSMMGM